MSKKRDLFDVYMEKGFPGSAGIGVNLAKPVVPARQQSNPSAQEPKKAVAAVGKENAEAESVEKLERRPGRPRKADKEEVMNMNFIIRKDVKKVLERMKFEMGRHSVTDLLNEAIYDLRKKYGYE